MRPISCVAWSPPDAADPTLSKTESLYIPSYTIGEWESVSVFGKTTSAVSAKGGSAFMTQSEYYLAGRIRRGCRWPAGRPVSACFRLSAIRASRAASNFKITGQKK